MFSEYTYDIVGYVVSVPITGSFNSLKHFITFMSIIYNAIIMPTINPCNIAIENDTIITLWNVFKPLDCQKMPFIGNIIAFQYGLIVHHIGTQLNRFILL